MRQKWFVFFLYIIWSQIVFFKCFKFTYKLLACRDLKSLTDFSAKCLFGFLYSFVFGVFFGNQFMQWVESKDNNEINIGDDAINYFNTSIKNSKIVVCFGLLYIISAIEHLLSLFSYSLPISITMFMNCIKIWPIMLSFPSLLVCLSSIYMWIFYFVLRMKMFVYLLYSVKFTKFSHILSVILLFFLCFIHFMFDEFYKSIVKSLCFKNDFFNYFEDYDKKNINSCISSIIFKKVLLISFWVLQKFANLIHICVVYKVIIY